MNANAVNLFKNSLSKHWANQEVKNYYIIIE